MIDRRATCINSDHNHSSIEETWTCREVSDLIWAQAEAKLANFMVANSFATGHGDTFDDLLRELEWQVRELRGRPKPGLYVHTSRIKQAKQLSAGPAYVDETLNPDDWYVIEEGR